ncbi:MAG: metallophosphoesterase [Phycisphaerales bacterium]|nr:metallophosphoesterase [Phycisphaerales bacterium]
MEPQLTRRDLIKTAGIAAAGLAISGSLPSYASAVADRLPRAPRRVLRVAHLTDMHIQPERKAGDGMATCWRHLAGQPDKPDLVLTGGDTVMDSFDADEARTRTQWDLWSRVRRDECGFQVESALGNHDVWGWNRKKARTTGEEARYGKKWACEMFGLDRPYRSFDRAGWHFVILDSVYPDGDGYTGRLDDEQFAWLESDLKAVPAATPVLVLSHIPILSASVLMEWAKVVDGEWRSPGSLMHTDAHRFRDLFLAHRNVKVCISGHLHLVERAEYNGVTYLCNGAVCGAWWKGRHRECDNGYAMMNLNDDGSFESEYITYGWQAQP